MQHKLKANHFQADVVRVWLIIVITKLILMEDE